VASVLNLVMLNGPRGPVSGILSEPRPGLETVLGHYVPNMRFVTAGDVRPGDVLSAPDGSRYAVTRTWMVGSYLVAEVAKEA
jgi:hypothetical protein